jgi:hypothetical protein
MNKEEMIKSIATAGVSKEYLKSLDLMPKEQVANEYRDFAASMKD